ncbi:Permease of the drug/metabolite transporter (DMT) superfamily [Thermococcus chitonophagus]|nr:Permease of the drug/metabolite transporter (DMT) superfamily [Thermococcus chitonophagus]
MLLYASLTSTIIFLGVNLREGRKFSVRENLYSAFLGFINPFLYYLVLFNAYSLLPAQEAQALNYTWPIILVVFSSAFLGQPLTIKEFFGVIVGFLGALVIGTHGNLSSLSFANPLGDALALSSALVWAMYWIFNLRDPRKAEEKMFWNFFFGSLYILALGVIRGIKFDPLGILGAVYIGTFEMGLTFLLWLKALEREDAGKVASLVYLTPVLSLVFISIVVGEKILKSTLLGLALILLGIMLSRRE